MTTVQKMIRGYGNREASKACKYFDSMLYCKLLLVRTYCEISFYFEKIKSAKYGPLTK